MNACLCPFLLDIRYDIVAAFLGFGLSGIDCFRCFFKMGSYHPNLI